MHWKIAGAALLFAILRLSAAPDNDLFENRVFLEGTNTSFVAYHVDATRETGEPRHAVEPETGYSSVWFSWTAPADGYVQISDGYNQLRWFIAVYRGENLKELSLVARSEPNTPNAGFPLSVAVKAGVTYQIVSAEPREQEPLFIQPTLRYCKLQFFPPAPNDHFENRTKVFGSEVTLTGHTIGATRESGDPLFFDFAIPNTVWWEWEAPFGGVASIQLDREVRFVGLIRPYRLRAEGIEPISLMEPDDRFTVEAGERVFLMAASYGAESAGPYKATLALSSMRVVSPANGSILDEAGRVIFRLENVPSSVSRIIVTRHPNFWIESPAAAPVVVVTNVPPGKYRFVVYGESDESESLYFAPDVVVTVRPGSDSFAAAREVHPDDTILGGDISAATVEPGEPFSAHGTVWWRWTAPARARVRMEPNYNLGRVRLDVYRGNAISDLEAVSLEETTDTSRPNTKIVSFTAEAQTVYYIRLSSDIQSSDWAEVSFTFQAIVPNDDFKDAIEISADGPAIIIPSGYSSYEPEDRLRETGDSGSRWFKYTARQNGAVFVKTAARVGLFSGDAISTLQSVGSQGWDESWAILRAGESCYISVISGNGLPEQSKREMQLFFVPETTNDDVETATEIPPASAGILLCATDLASLSPAESRLGLTEATVWYHFTAPQDGAFAARLIDATNPANISSAIRFFSKRLDGELVPAAWQGVELLKDEELLIAVSPRFHPSAPPRGRRFNLEHFFVERPPNDLFAKATLIEGSRFSVRGTNWNATVEPEEMLLASGYRRSTWYDWIAPESGVLRLETLPPISSASAMAIDLFAGETLTNLTAIGLPGPAANRYPALLRVVEKGKHYRIRVAGAPYYEIQNAFDVGGKDGFSLSGRLTDLAIRSITNNQVFRAGVPIPIEIAPASSILNGEVVSITLDRANSVSTLEELITLKNAPFRYEVTNLLPGIHEFQAEGLNASGDVLSTLPVRIRVTPANDEVSNAQSVTGMSTNLFPIVSGSTLNSGELGQEWAIGSVWYRWTPAAIGLLEYAAVPSALSFQSAVNVFASSNAASDSELVLLSTGPLWGAPGKLFVTPATNYFFQVLGSWTESFRGPVTTRLSIDLHTLNFVAPATNAVIVRTNSLVVRIGTTDALTNLLYVQLYEGSNLLGRVFPPHLTFNWTSPPPGKRVLKAEPVFVNGEIGVAATNTVTLLCTNDSFSQAEVLTVASGEVAGTFYGSSADSGATTANALKDVWFQYTAPADGLLALHMETSTPGGRLALFQGENWTNSVLQTNATGQFPQSSGIWVLRSNETYHISVNHTRTNTDFVLHWEFRTRAANDDFAGALRISGTEGEVYGDFVAATLEPVEPIHQGLAYPIVGSVWWEWIAPAEGLLQIEGGFQSGAMVIEAWSGETFFNLVPLPLEARNYTETNRRYFRVQAGAKLYFSLASHLRGFYGDKWKYRLIPAPENDNFANRSSLPARGGSVSGTIRGASIEDGESATPVQTASVWWSYVSPSDGFLHAHVTGLDSDSALDAFEGDSIGKLVPLWPIGEYHFFERETRVTPGQRVQFRITNPRPQTGDYTFNVWLTGSTDNDNFSNREPLRGSDLSVHADTRLASREFHEPFHAATPGGHSLWYTWRSETDGVLEISTEAPEYLLVAAYTGTTLTNLSAVASALFERRGSLLVPVRASTDYQIAVDNAWGYRNRNELRFKFNGNLSGPVLSVSFDQAHNCHIQSSEVTSKWSLEQSSDLVEWATVLQGPAGASIDWDLEPKNELHRFFRVRVDE